MRWLIAVLAATALPCNAVTPTPTAPTPTEAALALFDQSSVEVQSYR